MVGLREDFGWIKRSCGFHDRYVVLKFMEQEAEGIGMKHDGTFPY